MSTEFYLNKGFTPAFRSVAFSGTDTIAVWTPTTSTRVVLTNIQIATSTQSGTIAFYFGNLAGTKFAQFTVDSSTTISPVIGAIESTMYDRVIFAKGAVAGVGQWSVNLQGFELP